MEIERFVDEEMVRRVRQRWAFARDYGDWEGMRACFHPDATVCVSWFSGPAATFFERTVAMAAERRPEERLQAFLTQNALFRAEPFPVAHFSLIASYPTKSGSIYEDQADYALR